MAFSDITNIGTRPHPYSIAGSFRASSPIYESYSTSTRPSFTNAAPLLTTFRAASPARRTISAKRSGLSKPFGRLRTTRSFGCVGSSHIDDDPCQRMTYVRIGSMADDDEHDFNRSFFDGMGEGDCPLKQKTPKRTRSMADISLKSKRSWFASIRDHLVPPPMAKQNDRPYHYQKRSLRRAMSFQNDSIGEPSPDKHTLEAAMKRAGALDTAIRAIESASYIPGSPCSINTPDRSSGSSRPFASDDLASVSSASIYSPTSSPAPLAHRVLLPIPDKEDKAEQIPEAPQGYVFEQRRIKRSVSFENDKLPTPPLSPRRPRMVSFSRPTPQVYPYLTCHSTTGQTAGQETSQHVSRQSCTNFTRVNVPSKVIPAPSAPLPRPPPPNRNPKRTPSDSGHGPLIHATLDLYSFEGRQDKSGGSTLVSTAIVPRQSTPPPSSWRRRPLPSTGKRF